MAGDVCRTSWAFASLCLWPCALLWGLAVRGLAQVEGLCEKCLGLNVINTFSSSSVVNFSVDPPLLARL